MTNLFKIPTWADKEHIYAVVETPRGPLCILAGAGHRVRR